MYMYKDGCIYDTYIMYSTPVPITRRTVMKLPILLPTLYVNNNNPNLPATHHVSSTFRPAFLFLSRIACHPYQASKCIESQPVRGAREESDGARRAIKDRDSTPSQAFYVTQIWRETYHIIV
jgi:hypothetical protein